MIKLLFGNIATTTTTTTKSKKEKSNIDSYGYSFHIFTLLEENKNISKDNKNLFTTFDWSSLNRINIPNEKDLLWFKENNHLLLGVPKDAKKPLEYAKQEEHASEYIKMLIEKSFIRTKGDYDGYLKIKTMHRLKEINTYPVDPSIFENKITDMMSDVTKDPIEFYKIFSLDKKVTFNYIDKYIKNIQQTKIKDYEDENEKTISTKDKKNIKKGLISSLLVKEFTEQVNRIKQSQFKFKQNVEKYLNSLSDNKNNPHLSDLKNIQFNPGDNKKLNKHKIKSKVVFVKVVTNDDMETDFHTIDDMDFIKEHVKKWEENELFLTTKEIEENIKKNEKKNTVMEEQITCNEKIKNVVHISNKLLDTKNGNYNILDDVKNSAMEAHIYNFFSKELKDIFGMK